MNRRSFQFRTRLEEKMPVEEGLKYYFRMCTDDLPVPTPGDKSIDSSIVMRSEGNKSFLLGFFEEARLLYSQSLCMAPPYSVYAAIAYANRSAALYHLKAYKECIADIDRALDLPYPAAKILKLHSRREKAVAELMSERSINNETEVHNDDMNLAYGENPKALGVSNGVAIAYDEKNGAYLRATKTFKAGDVIAVQKPCVTLLFCEESTYRCHYCMKECIALIPCDYCIEAQYCSEDCRTMARQTYHRIECEIYRTSEIENNSDKLYYIYIMQLRLFLILTNQGTALDDLQRELQNNRNTQDIETNSFFGSETVVHALRAFLNSPRQIDDQFLRGRTLYHAATMSVILRNHTDFFKNNSDVVPAAKLLLALHWIAQTNCEYIFCNETGEKVAFTIYPLTNMIHHACVGNTITYSLKDNTAVIRACKTIKPGEQIFRNYIGPQSIDFDTRERQNIIRSAKLPSCNCMACNKEYNSGHIPEVDVPEELREKLRHNPYDIPSIWVLMEILRNAYKDNPLALEIFYCILKAVYRGRRDPVSLLLYRALGIL